MKTGSINNKLDNIIVEDKDKFNKLQIGLSAGSHFITDIYQSAYIGLIPFLTLKFGLSLFQVSLLGVTSVLANSLFSPVFGMLSDKHGLKYFMIAGPLITSIFLSILGIIPNYYLILILLFLGNLGVAAFHPASAAIAGHYGGKRKGIGSSLINFGGNFGNAVGSLLIILIFEKAGIEFTPLIMVPGIIMALVLIKYAPRNTGTGGSGNIFKQLGKIKRIKKAKLFLLFNILFIIYSLYIIWITLVNYMPLYFTERNISLINIGNILLIFGALGGASGFLSGFLYDRFKKGYIILQTSLVLSIPLFFFSFRTEGLLSIILFILAGFFLISVQPVCIRMTQDLFPGSMSLASSMILGFSPGLAAITMIFLGKAADIIGISALVNFELLGPALSFLLLFTYPVMERKLRLTEVDL
ncbi:MAG: MFS transporter [Actinobacteria bacterium]|nr:MFS transporter [Actinomycetota bacterium]